MYSRLKNVPPNSRTKHLEQGIREILGQTVTVQIAKRNELHTFKVMPKRWVAERSFAWLEKNRRLWKNCERKLNTGLQWIHLAFLALLLKRSRTGSKSLRKTPSALLSFSFSLAVVFSDDVVSSDSTLLAPSPFDSSNSDKWVSELARHVFLLHNSDVVANWGENRYYNKECILTQSVSRSNPAGFPV